jgi:hypothetical protein
MPSSDGLWHGRTTRGGIGNKVFFWSRHWDWRTELEPELVLTATRLDEQARSVRVTPATNAHGSDIRHAILSGLTLTAPGCWQLTADYSGYTLSYVVWVE